MRITGTSANYRTPGATVAVAVRFDIGGLTLTVCEDGQTPQSSTLTPSQARLVAQDLLDYAKRMEA